MGADTARPTGNNRGNHDDSNPVLAALFSLGSISVPLIVPAVIKAVIIKLLRCSLCESRGLEVNVRQI